MTGPAGAPPLATVVITTHDRHAVARRALSSALTQTLSNIEVVVVDDGSEPRFEVGVQDDRVRLFRREHAGGVCRARNVGLDAARGAWITFLDDDDLLVPDMLERSIAAAEASTLPVPVAVMATVEVLDVDGTVADTLVPPTALIRGDDFFLEGRGAAGRAANSLVAPTAVLRAIGGWDEQLETFEHDDLGLRLNAVASIQGLGQPLYRMTTHGAPRVSARWRAIPAGMERTLVKHAEAFARHPDAHARFMGVLGHYHLKAGHWLDAIRWSSRAVRRNPGDRRLWFFLASAVSGPHVRNAYRRVRPPDAGVSGWTLTRRRARKYSRRLANYPRAVVAAPIAFLVQRMAMRRLPTTITHRERSVLLCCVYRSVNARIVLPLVDEAVRRGWDVRFWALDHADAALAPYTVGVGRGAKFPLLNALVDDRDLDRFDWVVFADDDFVFDGGSVDRFLAVAEAANLDLVQPAHTELSHRELEIGVRRAFSVARRTTFVEIGPIFACRRPWTNAMLPFPSEHSMGWGLELDWFDLERRGARLGIIDAVPMRHLHPVGKGYAKDEQRERLRALLDSRGLHSIFDIQHTIGTWRPWQARPGWTRPQ